MHSYVQTWIAATAVLAIGAITVTYILLDTRRARQLRAQRDKARDEVGKLHNAVSVFIVAAALHPRVTDDLFHLAYKLNDDVDLILHPERHVGQDTLPGMEVAA